MEKKNNRFSPLEKHKIMELKSQGYGYKAIATRLELSCNAVKYFIRRHKDDPQYSSNLPERCKECGKELLSVCKTKIPLYVELVFSAYILE